MARYAVESLCFGQLGKLDCDGTPLAPENNTFLMHGLVQQGVTETVEEGEVTEVLSGGGVRCHYRKKRDRVTAYEATMLDCGLFDPALYDVLGIGNSTRDANGDVVGLAALNTAVDTCTCEQCGGDDCLDAFYLITWAQMWESCTTGAAARITDDAGNCLWHAQVWPKVVGVRPDGERTTSADATDRQQTWNIDLETNANFGFGPVDAATGLTVIPAGADTPAGLTTAWWEGQTAVQPPQICACGSESLWEGTGVGDNGAVVVVGS